MNIKRLHYLTGLIIAAFIGLHLINHIYSLAGAEKHIEIMDSFRQIYRNVFVEALLMTAVVVQIVSGIRLFRITRKTATTNFEKLHVWTGLYLAIFFVLHLSAVFGGRYILHLDTNFYFGVAGLNTFPFNLYFIPYYGLAIFSFFGHISAVHSMKMKHSIVGITPHKQSLIIALLGVLLVPVIFYGLTNHFKGVGVPKEYNVLIGK